MDIPRLPIQSGDITIGGYRGAKGLITFPLLLVESHGEAEGVYGEGEHNGGALLGRDRVQSLK